MVMVDPAEVTLGRNTRWEDVPLDPDKIEARYRSFVADGQLSPVRVRKDGDRLVLVWGFYRHAAALLYNERHPESPMRLKVVAAAMNAEEALLESITENRERHATSPMDDAHAQKRLREELGWTDAQIAERYGYGPSAVSRLRKLLYLSRDLQLRVHAGELSVKAACAAAGLAEDERAEVLQEVLAEDLAADMALTDAPAVNGQATVTHINKRLLDKVRDKKIAKGGAVSRTLADVRKFFAGLEGKAEDGEFKEFCKTMLKFMAGGVGEATVAKKLKEWISEKSS